MSMEKKRNCCPVDACEKFFKAITVSSPFRPIRRISNHHHNEDSMPSNPAPNLSAASASIPTVKTHHTQKHPKPVVTPGVVPIKLDHSAPHEKNGNMASVALNKNMEPISKFVHGKNIASKHKAEAAAAAAAAQEKRYKATRMESNNKKNANIEDDEFTRYIKRAGNKFRAPSSGDGKNGKINESASISATGEDHFSDYINRAKKKMLRTMSSFVGGRSDTMK